MTESNITTYYGADHDRLDNLFKSYQELKRKDFPKAKSFFKEFKFGLQRHIIWEEDILFTAFEGKTGMTDGGPTHVMRLEHRQIGAHLEAIHVKVKQNNPDTDAEEQNLLAGLTMHNQKEEAILYPMLDRLLNNEERASVFSSMKALPEERYQQCCQPLKT